MPVAAAAPGPRETLSAEGLRGDAALGIGEGPSDWGEVWTCKSHSSGTGPGWVCHSSDTEMTREVALKKNRSAAAAMGGGHEGCRRTVWTREAGARRWSRGCSQGSGEKVEDGECHGRPGPPMCLLSVPE